MKLNDYIKKEKVSITELAKRSGCKQPHMSLILSGLRNPSPAVAKRISEATNGEVGILELLYPADNAA